MTFARTSSLFVLLIALLAGAVMISAVGLSAMGHGDWGMGGHMGHMMGGGTNSANSSVTVGGTSESAAIRDFAFTPGNLQVPVGAKVTWTNYDDAPHSATARGGTWDSGILSKGDSKTLTFDTAGDYTYYCTVHPSMVARLQVR